MFKEELYFLKSPPIVMWEESNFGGSSQAITFVGPNPDRSAKIIYYLKKRHTFGAMSLDILNMEGNKVISLDPGKQKGINIVRWSYTGKAPKVAKGKTFAFGGFGAPRVPAGIFQVLIKKGKEQYEFTIELREKISQLYGVVISNYDKPSAIQEETKNTLDKSLKDSQRSFESRVAKHQKNIEKFTKSANLEFPKIDDFITFIEK